MSQASPSDPVPSLSGERVCVLGAGSFGSAVAHTLGAAGARVVIWARRPSVSQEINAKGTNRQYVPEGMRAAQLFGKSVSATSDLAEALQGCTVIVVAVPSAFLGPLLVQVRACGERRVFDPGSASLSTA